VSRLYIWSLDRILCLFSLMMAKLSLTYPVNPSMRGGFVTGGVNGLVTIGTFGVEDASLDGLLLHWRVAISRFFGDNEVSRNELNKFL
jgi:hypothetical protein